MAKIILKLEYRNVFIALSIFLICGLMKTMNSMLLHFISCFIF